jgi:peptidyl-prolyl cis-trans isomerase SurA
MQDPIVSEFEYIYSKTNGDNADFSKASLDEYLDLYTKFKLKVKRAKDMKLDTIPSLNQELAGYRRQLADSYLMDKEVMERLTKEVYERKKQDVDIAHILVTVPKNATKKQEAAALLKIQKAQEAVKAGKSFAEAALEFSEDKNAKKNYGRLGYVSALFPNGYYNLETAAYSLPIKTVSEPIRTSAGFHLLKVFERRPARGEVEINHILRRVNKAKVPKRFPKSVIDSIYIELGKGADFEALARSESEDKTSASKGGYIGFFGINKYEKKFEDAAFGLLNDGDFSEPFETSAGWHIAKRISRKDLADYNIERARLQNQIKKDARYQEARQSMIERIQKEGNLRKNEANYNELVSSLDSNFTSFKWKPTPSDKALISLGNDYTVTVGEFGDYLAKASRKRLSLARSKGVEKTVETLYEEFLEEKTLAYEERQLEAKYPEFRNLMREYEEGILLFEATKMLVWDKASQDTTGLKAFFATTNDKYKWKERVRTTTYMIDDKNGDMAEKIRQYSKDHTPTEVKAKFNTAENRVVKIMEEKTYEKGRNEEIDAMKWKVSSTSFVKISKKDKSRTFIKIEEVLPAEPKTLAQARGYVVADYQDHLEKQWVEQLRKDYTVKVNQKVFKALVKK